MLRSATNSSCTPPKPTLICCDAPTAIARSSICIEDTGKPSCGPKKHLYSELQYKLGVQTRSLCSFCPLSGRGSLDPDKIDSGKSSILKQQAWRIAACSYTLQEAFSDICILTPGQERPSGQTTSLYLYLPGAQALLSSALDN